MAVTAPEPLRLDLLARCREAHVGLALMTVETRDVNERTMAGASNKAFDYLACGLPLVIADDPDWRRIYEEAEVAVVCNPREPASISAALATLLSDRERAWGMGERGRLLILSKWNYERAFAPVRSRIEAVVPKRV